jgi:prepilin-type N-terminal cleavage/methylation domain-containing protein
MKKNYWDCGFVMIEVLIAIFILSLIFIFFMFSNRLRDIKVDFFIKEFITNIEIIKSENMKGNNNALIVINNNESYINYDFIIDKDYSKSINSISNINFLKAPKYIKFSKNGGYLNRGETIIIKDKKENKLYKITIVPMSGRISYKGVFYE